MTRDTIIKLSCSVAAVIVMVAGSWFACPIGLYLNQVLGSVEQYPHEAKVAVPLLDMDKYPQLLLKRSTFTRATSSLGFTFLWQSENGKILPSWIARGYTSWVIGDHTRPTVKLKYTYSGVIDNATFYISTEDLESKRYVR